MTAPPLASRARPSASASSGVAILLLNGPVAPVFLRRCASGTRRSTHSMIFSAHRRVLWPFQSQRAATRHRGALVRQSISRLSKFGEPFPECEQPEERLDSLADRRSLLPMLVIPLLYLGPELRWQGFLTLQNIERSPDEVLQGRERHYRRAPDVRQLISGVQ